MEITKYQEVLNNLEEQVRFYISTPEKLAEALLFAKKLKQFAEQVEDKVKEKGSQLMSDQDLREIEIDGWKVVKIDPSETITYLVSSVFNAIGDDQVAKGLMKVDGTKLKLWIKKSKVEGEMIEKINEGKKVKPRMGYIKILQIKQDEN